MAYFKNLLILTRNEITSEQQVYLKNNSMWFDEDKPFQYTSPLDQIILFYDDPLVNDELEKMAFLNKKVLGFIHLLNDDINVKVSKFKFNVTDIIKYLITFREYLISTIKTMNLSNDEINSKKFCLHWDSMYITHYRTMLTHIYLLTTNDTYTFTSFDINNTLKDDNKFEKETNVSEVKNTLPNTFTFPTNSLQPAIQPTTQPTTQSQCFTPQQSTFTFNYTPTQPASTTLPSTTLPSTTLPSTTLPTPTLPSTTLPSTTLPSTTLPSTTSSTFQPFTFNSSTFQPSSTQLNNQLGATFQAGTFGKSTFGTNTLTSSNNFQTPTKSNTSSTFGTFNNSPFKGFGSSTFNKVGF